MKKIMLPFETKVPTQAYLDTAIPQSILLGHRFFDNVMAVHNIQVFFSAATERFTKRFRITPTLDRAAWERMGLLKVEEIGKYNSMQRGDAGILLRDIMAMINDGNYIECRLDEYYVPGRPLYKHEHRDIHINILVGFDLEARSFSIAGYGRTYEVSTITFDDFIHAFFSEPSSDYRSKETQYFWWKTLWSWTRMDLVETANNWAENLNGIRIQLEAYLSGRAAPTGKLFERSENDYGNEPGSWGIKTYKDWINYVDTAKQEGRRLDLRATRSLWEHKICMVRRLKTLSRNGIRIAASTNAECLKLEGIARGITLMAINFNRTLDATLGNNMINGLMNIDSIEVGLCHELNDQLSGIVS
jgi:hypothetical protein